MNRRRVGIENEVLFSTGKAGTKLHTLVNVTMNRHISRRLLSRSRPASKPTKRHVKLRQPPLKRKKPRRQARDDERAGQARQHTANQETEVRTAKTKAEAIEPCPVAPTPLPRTPAIEPFPVPPIHPPRTPAIEPCPVPPTALPRTPATPPPRTPATTWTFPRKWIVAGTVGLTVAALALYLTRRYALPDLPWTWDGSTEDIALFFLLSRLDEQTTPQEIDSACRQLALLASKNSRRRALASQYGGVDFLVRHALACPKEQSSLASQGAIAALGEVLRAEENQDPSKEPPFATHLAERGGSA
eukprot:g53182.t1